MSIVIDGKSGANGTPGVSAVDTPKTTDVPRNFVEWAAGNQARVTNWVGEKYSQYLGLLTNDATLQDKTPNLDNVSKVVHTGSGPIKGAIYLCVDDSYKGPGTKGDAEFIQEFKAALDKTDFGKFYEVRLITTKDGIETVAKTAAMNEPPNMSIVMHGDALAANQRWNKAVGDRPDWPFTNMGLAPNQFDQAVSVGPCASKAEYSNPKLMALVACHELGHRLFNIADGAEKGQTRKDGTVDNIGGWGDFPIVKDAKPGEPGSLNLMWDGQPLTELFNRYAKGGKPLPDEIYKFPDVFRTGLGNKFGIMSYLNGLPLKK
jgi:hypothetical protein